MFEASLSDTKLFTTIARALSLVTEATFIADSEGIHLAEMDDAKVAMVELELPGTVFEKYSCPQKTAFKVLIDDLLKISKRVNSADIIHFKLDSENSELQIKLEGRFVRIFSIPLKVVTTTEIEDIERRRQIQLTFKASIKVIPDVIKNVIKDAKIVGDYVEIKATKDKLLFASGSSRGTVHVYLDPNHESVLEYKVDEHSLSLYPLSYLEETLAAAPASDIACLNFYTNMPMRLDFLIPGGGRISYYIAPRREV